MAKHPTTNHVCKHCNDKFKTKHANFSQTCPKCKQDINRSNCGTTNCISCGKEFIKQAANQTACSKDCRKKAISLNYEAQKEKTHFKIFERDDFKCTYCGKSSIEDGVKLCVDHVYPRSAELSNDIDNLTTSCSDCNTSKQASILSDKTILRIWNRNRQLNIKYKYSYEELKEVFNSIYKK